MIGDRGEKLVLDRGVDSKLKAWLKEVWKAFKGSFGLADLTDEQVEKMTLEEFVDTINAELLSGREFGAKKKLPPSEKSVKRYDEAEGSGSNGLLRWRNDRGYLFAIPVDMERTQPGGKVVFATDDVNITDWIQSALNGYDLRMSKSGKLYVKGRNGLPDELALIFGRFPTIGGNDGLRDELAAAVGNDSLKEISVEDLVSSLKSDRANYDAWAKAKSEGKSLDEARQEEHYADEAAREEAERKARWENSGMGILDYIRSRMEDGDPEFDLDWEIAREMANNRAEARFSARALIDGRETAVSAGYPLSIRDARDPEKVLPILSSIVGKSAAQIGEMKLTRINTTSIEHLLNSKEARWDRDGTSRDAKRIWRGRVGGISVIDDIIATSDLGLEEAPAHFNKNWKKGAKFYKADTRFAIEVERGYEIYPCQLIVAELKNGERFVYDLVEIKKPTLSASAGNANLSMTKRSTSTGESVASSESISQTGGAAQARFSLHPYPTFSGVIYPSFQKSPIKPYENLFSHPFFSS